MNREVDRLLKNLATTLGRPSESNHAPPAKAPASHASTQPRNHGVRPSPRAPTRRDQVALWARVLLGVTFGGLMTQWPYPYGCGPSLYAYLGAVATVMLAAAWIAFASWKLRSALAHILSLILFYWGLVLAAEHALPRIGYAAEDASWRCPSGSSSAVPAQHP